MEPVPQFLRKLSARGLRRLCGILRRQLARDDFVEHTHPSGQVRRFGEIRIEFVEAQAGFALVGSVAVDALLPDP